MSVIVAAASTHVGNVREHNEDRYFFDTNSQVFMVADGMGGHAAGEVASASAVERVVEAWTSMSIQRRIEAYAAHGDARARRALLQAIREGVEAAHLSIVSQARADERKRGMGTTFTGFIVAGGEAVFAHAGDSRAYLYRDGITMQLSEDHTVVARLHAAGIAPDPGEQSWTGMLTNALGVSDAGTNIATFLVRLYPGDRFLLCSDGVYEYFDEVEIGAVLADAPSPARAANQLIQTALDRGGHDNATAVVIKVVEADETVVPKDQRDRDEGSIARCPLFCQLSPQERLRALRITTTRELNPGRELAGIALGTRVAYVVLDGTVGGPRGERKGPGDVIYPEALIDGPAWTPEQVYDAQTPVRLLTIRRDDFLELTEEESALGDKLLAALSRLTGGD